MLRLIRAGTLPLMKTINAAMRKLTSTGHHLQMAMEWGVKPNPEWFDHFIDQHYQWTSRRLPFFLERGVFNLLAIKPNSSVLELCCGDGFNAHHFYSIRAAKVHSVDFDPAAIAHANRYFKAPNVTYGVADIRASMPSGTFDNVIWDAAIEHFTEAEIARLMRDIRKRLRPGGVLSGYTILEEAHEQHHEHEYEFKSKADLARFLTPHFENVLVLQTSYPKRRNLYFFASDAVLPFDEDWEHALRICKSAEHVN